MSDINEMLLEFAGRFRLDGDLLRCIDCNRGIVASRMDEDFVHAPSCKSRTTGGRPWAALQGILAGPLVDMLKSATAELAAVKAERDALIRNINDAFLSLNIPHSTLAFDGRNLLPHAEESARYAEAMRIERDKALSDVAKYVDRSESFASAIDHLVSNTADGTDLARITKERDDFRDGMVAMLVAAGAPVDLDAMEAAVSSAGKKPSDFISQRIRVLTAERDALWADHRDMVDERDALKAKLDDPRRVLIHETEVVATKEEIATLKAKLAALVKAYSEFYEATFTDLESCLTSEDIVLRGNLGDAIAAARGGAVGGNQNA